ncbi:MAG: helix-turn-helix transcriptional regulator [Bauldia sp.]|nr:helix-turn-helix transcriptional regulator [Bauldia sp.]
MRLEELIGLNVRRLRQAKGLTQEALAHGAEIDTRYVGGIERGEENPSVAVIGRLAKILDACPADLLMEQKLDGSQNANEQSEL